MKSKSRYFISTDCPKRSSQPATGLLNRRPLKVLNDTKLNLDYPMQMGHSETILESFLKSFHD